MMKAIAGTLFWLALIAGSFTWLSHGTSGNRQRMQSLWNYLSSKRQSVVLKFEQTELIQVGDQIFLEQATGSPAIGRITRVETPTSSNRELTYSDYAEAVFYNSAPELSPGAWLSLHQGPDSIAWVIETMLSPQIRGEIQQLLSTAFRENQTELVTQLQPLLMESLRRSSEVIREDFRQAILGRSDQLRKISKRYEEEFLRTKLTPLLRQQVWPLIQRESEPLANEIGQQLWDQASLWRLSWRMLYDASPLPQRDLTRKEFERFVDEHVIPTLQAHLPDFIELQRKIFAEVLANEQFRAVVGEGFEKLALDQELQQQLLGILNDVVTDNPRLKEVWREVWSTPQAQAALSDANTRLEPTIRAIGEAMFGNPRTRITPEFSLVLRNRVLFKDQRWLVLHVPDNDATAPAATPAATPAAAPATIPVRPGEPNSPNPFHVPARSRE